MYYKFSKMAKTIIIINVILTLIVGSVHVYNAHRLKESNEIILNYMEEHQVIKNTAIRLLENDGVELFINYELTTYFGIVMTVLTLFMLYKFGKNNGFFFGFFAAVFSVFTSLIGGLLLFYLMFSGKSEVKGNSGAYSLRNEWEKFIHSKGSED